MVSRVEPEGRFKFAFFVCVSSVEETNWKGHGTSPIGPRSVRRRELQIFLNATGISKRSKPVRGCLTASVHKKKINSLCDFLHDIQYAAY